MNNRAMARVEWIRSSAGLFILVMMMGGIIFYIFVIPPEERTALLEGISNESITLLDVSPGEITKATQEFERETTSLGDIVVDNSKHTMQEVVSNQFMLTSNMFQNTVADFTFDADINTLQSANLQFYIYSKEGNGVLNVKLNGYSVFSGTADVGNKIVVNFPLNKIIDGVNSVKVYISSGLSTSRYTIIDMRLMSEDYALGKDSVQQSFSLPDYDSTGVRDVRLNAYVVQQAESANLNVNLNGETIFSGIPSSSFEVQLSNSGLNEGTNELEWTVSKDGKYRIEFVRVSYNTLQIKGKEKTFYFDVDSDNKDRIDSDRYSCELFVERRSGVSDFTVTINDRTKKFKFDDTNEISTSICDELASGLNELKISAEDTIDIKQLSVKLVLK